MLTFSGSPKILLVSPADTLSNTKKIFLRFSECR